MTIEAATYVNDLNTANPGSSDLRSEGDDHLRLMKTVLKATFPYMGGVLFKVTAALSGAQSPTFSSQNTNIYAFSGNGTLNLPAVATAGNGWMMGVYAPSGVTVTIDPDAAETINGSGTLALTAGFALVFNSGSAWYALTTVSESPRFLGEIAAFAGSTVPSGWLLCYGQAISRSTYASLFAVIGTTHGAGDGSTTFNLPDLRGRNIAGVDNMGGSAASRLTADSWGAGFNAVVLGAAGGLQYHTLTTAETPVHTHSVTDPGHSHTQAIGSGAGYGQPAGALPGSSTSTSVDTTGITIGNTGSGNSHPNVQPTMVLNYIIKAS